MTSYITIALTDSVVNRGKEIFMKFQAHKGVCSENPENTMPSYLAAIEQGYAAIELDVRITADGKFVLLHDPTINRTARMPDGEPIPHPIAIREITYTEALKYDFGLGFSKKFRGTKIPLLEDVLKSAQANGVKVKIDHKYQDFTEKETAAFFSFLKPYEKTASLTCSRLETIKVAAGSFPNMDLHYDGKITADLLQSLSSFLPKERLTLWLPLKNANTSWVKTDFATPEAARQIKQYGRLGIWILSEEEELEEAIGLGADIVETNGQLKPTMNRGRMADMHTHSEYSHDSLCKIDDMATAQWKKQTDIFAVTDHFDTDSHSRYDIFTPIDQSCEFCAKLNKSDSKRITVLKGIEISEGFWHPEVYSRIAEKGEFDAILGSVHLVQFPNEKKAYSKIDFSKFDDETIAEYLDAYFSDVITMLDTVDFDILSHLTCPLRYINGKYHRNAEISRYREKINTILKTIIQRGIALEINTSAWEALGDFMPSEEILKTYRRLGGDFMPSEEILKTYRRLGGYLITLGSDAHRTEHASQHFDKAVRALKRIGFRNIFYYEDRKAKAIRID